MKTKQTLRSRIVLVILVLVSAVTLYSLPRVVVENDEETLQEQGKVSNPAAPDTQQLHADVHHSEAELPDSVLQLANDLRSTMLSLKSQKKKLIFADSLAQLYRIAGRYDSAAVYMDLKVEAMPSLEHLLQAGDLSYEAMGFAMDQSRRFAWAEKARNYYNRVLKEDQDLPDVRVKIGMTHLSGNNPMVGITMIRQVAEEHPENTLALYQLGILSVTTGQYDKAIERLDKLAGLEPFNAEAIFYLGYSYFETGRYEEARTRFEDVLKLEVSPELQESATQYLEQIDNI